MCHTEAALATTCDSRSRTQLRVERLKQRLGFDEVGGVEALGKPAQDRCEQVAGIAAAALAAVEPGQVCRGAQFERSGVLALRDL